MKQLVTSIIVVFILFLFGQCESPERVIYYSEFGAVGDGVTDDFDAISKAHAAANKAGVKVHADAGATYYIGAVNNSAEIQTDTDWGDAKFIIDDSKVEVKNSSSNIFKVSSKLPSSKLTTVKTLSKNQAKLDLTLPYRSFIVVTDTTTMRYIRFGLNQNNGAPQTDVFVVEKNGNVDMKAPIIWDYQQISTMTVYPIDDETLTVSGGHFTTIANQADPQTSPYYSRNISISRSNVVIEGLHHMITGELEYGAPYSGFITISNCSEVTVQNCKLSGHKVYWMVKANGPVQRGTYDISVRASINVTFKDCKQLNDIHDENLWGIFGSNYSKNLVFDNVEFSRFDAHMGVVNATVKNSILGRQGINLIGCGTFLVENTKVCSSNLISLRSDYGSTWEGEVIIRNCEFFPRNGAQSDAVLINGSNSGQHDFGYTCYMPRKITIDGLVINDVNHPEDYSGPKIFTNFNKAFTSEAYIEKYPYVIAEEIVINNLTIKSGKPYIISNNPFMFRNVIITEK